MERQHKHLEDLLDGLICAWTAAYWARHGLARSQVLGATDPVVDERGRRGTIVAPARPPRAPQAIRCTRPRRDHGGVTTRQPRRSPKRSCSTSSRFFTSVSLGILDSPSVRSMNTIATSVGRSASFSARCFISIWKP